MQESITGASFSIDLRRADDPNIIPGMQINWLKVPQWEKDTGLLHGFVGRQGGNSLGAYAGLNVSYRVGDDPKIVSQNVCDLKLAVGIHDGRIVTMKQVHGDRLIEVKTTQFGALTPFFASKNEVSTSEQRASEYQLYRVFGFKKEPKLFILPGALPSTCILEATQFSALPR